jgi:cell division protein FtsL
LGDKTKMKKKFSFAVIFFIAGIFLAGLISTRAFQEAYRSRKIQKEVEDLQAEAKHVQGENKALTEQIAYLQTPEFQEKVAKEKLNLQKPDENVVVVNPSINNQSQSPVVRETMPDVKPDVPNYMKWWNLFFKYD